MKALEAYQRGDINRLHGANPFGGTDLGLTPEQMAANIGGGVDQAQTEYKSDLSNIEGQAAMRGAPAATSGAFYRNRQRAAGGLLARSAETRRQAVMTDAELRRRDLYNRLGAESGALTGNAPMYNYGQAVRGQQQGAMWGGLSSLLAALSMGKGGSTGGTGGYTPGVPYGRSGSL